MDDENITVVANVFTSEKTNWSHLGSDVNAYATKPLVESLVALLVKDN